MRKHQKYVLASGVVCGLLLSAGSSASVGCLEADRVARSLPQSPVKREAVLVAAIKGCPTHAASLNNLGLMREEQGRLAEAEDLYRRAIASDVDFPEAYAGLGDVLKAKSDKAGAADAYRRFLSLAADHPHLKPHVNTYKERLAVVAPSGALVGSTTILAALTMKPKKSVRMRGVNIVGRDLDQPHIDIAIQFDFNSARIRAGSVSQVAEIATALKASSLAGVAVKIEGHTDAVGSDSYNLALSHRRALSVKNLLVDRFGVDPVALDVVGMGETTPIQSNDTEDGRARNRRVTFINTGS